MFSNSEMQKRAELAKQEAKKPKPDMNSHSELVGDSIARSVNQEHSDKLEKNTFKSEKVEHRGNGDSKEGCSKNSSADSEESSCTISEASENAEFETTCQTADMNPEINSESSQYSNAENVEPNGLDSEKCENTSSMKASECVKQPLESTNSKKSDSNSDSPNTAAVISESNGEKTGNNNVTITHFDLSMFPKD